MSLARIRDYYKVPAYRGRRICWWDEGRGVLGTILGAQRGSMHLRVRLDGQKRSVILHPAYHVIYIRDAPRPVAAKKETA